MKKNYVHLVLLIDRSGSMETIKKDMEGGLKTFLENQKQVEGECTVTLAQFDNEMTVYNNFDDISKLGEIKIVPRGSTALIDSMCKLIDQTGTSLRLMQESKRPEKVIFVTITDGQENSSREFRTEHLKQKIKTQQEQYAWEFVYLGSNQDAINTASQYGIRSSSSMTYTGDTVSFMASTLDSAVTRSRGGGSVTFSEEEQKTAEKNK